MKENKRIRQLIEQGEGFVILDVATPTNPQLSDSPDDISLTDAATYDTKRGYVPARIEHHEGEYEAVYEYDGEVRSESISKRCVRPVRPVNYGMLPKGGKAMNDTGGDDA